MLRRRGASLLWFSPIVLMFVAMGERESVRAMQQGGITSSVCDIQAVSRSKAEFQRLSSLRRFDPNAVTMETLRAASLEYVAQAEACYQQMYGTATEVIDDGGILAGSVPGASDFGLNGRKWGAGSPFISTGPDANGPRIPGGMVTYSFMANGVQLEGATAGPSVAIPSLPTFSPCFIQEITDAFSVWAAIANIQFTQVADNGAPFDAAGATGDIRIAAHVFDGPSGVLAHGYFPQPNGVSAAGDIHFDVAETWSCTPAVGSFDFGIVAAHEIGHAIGLDHENRFGANPRTALMNPFYNPALVSPLGDDINGAENIYGSAVGNSPNAIVDFGDAHGLWILNYGVSWTQVNSLSPEEVVTGDLDGNGIDDIIVDFGPLYGVWISMNNVHTFQLHTVSPTRMAVGDLDNSGRDDIVVDFEGFGIWQWMNNTSWTQLHTLNSSMFAIGNVDNLLGDDVVMTFPGNGVWRRMNNTTWVQVHQLDADQIAIGDLDETALTTDNADDFVLNLPGIGVVTYLQGVPLVMDSKAAVRMATGDISGDGRDELVVDFGPDVGIWILRVGAVATQLHSLSSEGVILGDLDGNGQAEIVVDLGTALGIWIRVNNASWIQAHNVSPEGFAIADLD